MKHEFLIAWRYFFSPSTTTPKLIPRAGMFGLALSIIVLLTTLSVMNGFDRHIKNNVIARLPHMSSPTLNLEQAQQLQQSYSSKIEKVGVFEQTRVLVPQWNYLQVSVFISDAIEEPAVSSRLFEQFNFQLPSSIECLGFSSKKVLGQAYPINLNLKIDSVHDDSVYAFYFPTSYKETFSRLSLQPITAMWVFDPINVQSLKSQIQSDYPQHLFYSWVDQYSSLFDALAAEKRLVGIVLSLLIILIFCQLNLTMMLIFKDKQKDMVTLACFLRKKESIKAVFSFYSGFNILFGVALGSVLGWLTSIYLPSVLSFFEKNFGFEVLPYGQYAFDRLPSLFLISDLLLVSTFALVVGGLCSALLVHRLSQKNILDILKQHQ